ncbi:hypothetical protein F5Y04DRAFT_283780 [Hypomontagnella monticulosa]|nr:hypothetical protein F5Y04DRAFT_283780 [Hypomontagnella monticulosa]
MKSIISLVTAACLAGLAAANPIAQAGTTTCLPVLPTEEVSGSATVYPPAATPTMPIPPEEPKRLSICCCCMNDPQPDVDDYIAECPRPGVLDVCGYDYTGDLGYTLGGLEGQPEEIAKVCSSVRCGPVHFTD